MGTIVKIARLADLAEGVMIGAQVDGVELIVLRCGVEVQVFQGLCPHQQTMLAGGSLERGVLTCPGHGWRFDCATGQKTGNPSISLKRFSAEITNGEVGVDRNELSAWRTQTSRPTAAAASRPFTALPGPRRLPLLGNLLQLDSSRLHLILEQWAKTYGSMYRFKIANKHVVALAETELIQDVLRHRPERYRRLSAIAGVLMEMGANGVFAAEGKEWRRQRRITMQALNMELLRYFFPKLSAASARLKARWERAARGGYAVDVQKDLMRYTVDVTTNLVFGYDVYGLETEGNPLQQHLEKVLPAVNRRVNAPFPYWHFIKLPADRALDKALAGIRDVVLDLIAQSRARFVRDGIAQPRSFLEVTVAAGDDPESALSEEEIVGNVLTLLVAGEDTTANTMAWMMHLITRFPEVQVSLQKEADSVLGEAVTLDHFQDHERLRYLEAVANETMRLKPVAPMLFLETKEAVELGGIDIPAGTALFLLTRQIAMQERAFTAAAEFRPQRWLAAPDTASRHDPAAFLPFGGGPRFCPGRYLAMLEVKAVMAMLCRNFSIAATGGAVDERFAFTMMPANLSIQFTAR